MASRLRGTSSLKERTKVVTSYAEDSEDQPGKIYKNGSRDNRYHFGMTKNEEFNKNNEEHKVEGKANPDLLYRRSKEHFGAWNIKDIVHDENGRPKKSEDRFDDARLTNGKLKADLKKHERESRDEGYVGSLPREDRVRTGSADRDPSGPHRSRKKDHWESAIDTTSRSSRSARNNGIKNDDEEYVDERDLLLREIESLAVDGSRSPDRRIKAMIERFKSREENKKSRKEQRSVSPEKTNPRNDRLDYSTDNRVADRYVRRKDDREEDRRSSRSKSRGEKFDQQEASKDARSDRRSRSIEKFRESSFAERDEDSRKEKSSRRKSREFEDEQPRIRDNSKRRSYAYEGSPEDFDVRIQRYERGLVEPRKDPELSKRGSSKDRDHDLSRKESFKEHDRVARKNSFKDAKKSSSKDRESSLSRKTSFKEPDNDHARKNSMKSHSDNVPRYFGKDQENDSLRKSSFKEQGSDLGRRNSLKEANSDYGRILFKTRESEAERNNSFKGHSSGVSRITFKEPENEPIKSNAFKSQDAEVSRVTFKDHVGDSGRRNSWKEKTVEFGGISFKEDDDVIERRNSYRDQDGEPGKVTFREYDEPGRKKSPNGRYVEFGRVSFMCQDDESGRAIFKDQDTEMARKGSFKDQDTEMARRGSFKDQDTEMARKGSFKDQDTEMARKESYKEQDTEMARKESFKDQDTEMARKGSFKDPDAELGRKGSFKDQDTEMARKGSFKERDSSSRRRTRNKDSESLDRKSNRHSRPLTPPKYGNISYQEDSTNREDFCTRTWYENNKIFAAKYLKENSKVRTTPEGRSEIEREFMPETSLPVQEFRDAKRVEARDDEDDDDKRDKFESVNVVGLNGGIRDNEPRYAATHERNGATVIRIRTSAEDAGVERRRRRRPAQDVYHGRRRRNEEDEDTDEDDDEEDDYRQRSRRDGFPPGRSVSTPSRRLWNYREGGVLITDVEEGQPCLQCGETCPGFSPHSWRKNCTSCKCPREAHNVCHEEWVSVRSRLGLKGEETTSPVGFDPREKGLAWVPPGLPAHKVEEYFSMLPEISIPRLGTAGERHRDRQLAIQLPKQDLARAYCRHLDPKHASSADDFMAARNEIALDIGSVQEVLERDIDCGACHAPLKYGSLAVSASKLGLLYHPACFRCGDCKELLVDLAYCLHDDTLFCERHYAEQLKPRCAACDELIFSGEYTKAMNKDWHSGHFCCWQCDESLTGQRYVLRDEHPYCIKCYESVFANGCEECNKIIGIDSKDLSYKDKHWHEACFLCNRCRVSLVDKQFGSKVDKIYCGNCYDAQFASRCDGCGEIFRAGTKKMEYKTRQWHEKCFCCVVCKNPIGTKSFIPREQEIYCAGCYEDKFATRCVKCNKIITSGGVTYKNEPWHRDCFTCSNCNNSLAGQRFTSRDDKPYCADCFGELFAKRCTACSKPITGIGGTRFISFEDRHWHNDCFICAGCKTSLVGRGFITDGEDIICPECAKMKLM